MGITTISSTALLASARNLSVPYLVTVLSSRMINCMLVKQQRTLTSPRETCRRQFVHHRLFSPPIANPFNQPSNTIAHCQKRHPHFTRPSARYCSSRSPSYARQGINPNTLTTVGLVPLVTHHGHHGACRSRSEGGEFIFDEWMCLDKRNGRHLAGLAP